MGTLSVPSPRGPIRARQAGSGPVLLLVAGLGSTHRIWGDLPDILGRSFTVLAPDNRGVGGSREGEPFSFAGAAADLVALLDHLDRRDARVVGVSLGGRIALELCLRHPDRVRRLVVASAAAETSEHGRRMLRTLREMLLHLPPESVGQALMTLAFAPPFHARHPEFVRTATILYGPAPEDVQGALAQVDAALAQGPAEVRQLDVPALVLCGDRDPVVAPEDTRALAGAMPGARLLEVAGAAHSVLAEGGQGVLEELVEFLRRDEPR